MAYQDLDAQLGKDIQAVLKEVKKFASDVVRPAGEEIDDLSDPMDAIKKDSPLWEVFKGFRGLDLHTLDIPIEAGGMAGDVDPLTRVVVAERLGYADAGLALSLMASDAAFRFAAGARSKAIKNLAREYCGDVKTELVGGLAYPEVAAPGVKADTNGKKYALNGQCSRVVNAGIASHVIIPVDINGQGRGLALVSTKARGVSVSMPIAKMGTKSLNHGDIILENTSLTSTAIADKDSAQGKLLYKSLAPESHLTTAAVFAGLAQAAFDEALAYAKNRVQGGKPICEHNNIRHMLFDMFQKAEAARAFVRTVAASNSLPHAAAAKIQATETASDVTSMAVQVLGGYGLTKEFPIEKMFRDAKAGMVENGVNEILALDMCGLL